LVFLALALLPLLWSLLRGFVAVFVRQGYVAGWALRWALFSVILIQWIFQPFLYSDQQMFVVGFVFIGFVLAEFRSKQPLDSHAR
jgi:hypothetical protein